jgi:hypothetical protein
MTASATDLYYDPYNVNMNADPYPVYRRSPGGAASSS